MRLPPNEFRQLPAAIVVYLTDRNCTIPQSYATAELHNVVSGAFHGSDQAGWAVLCSVSLQSRIIVFAGQDTVDVSEIGAFPDRRYLQGIGSGRIAYSRYLAVASADRVAEVDTGTGKTTVRAIEHDGLEDVFLEKGSVLHYHHADGWIRLVGAN